MSFLTLTSKQTPAAAIDWRGIEPGRLQGLTLTEVQRLEVPVDGGVCQLGECMRIRDGQRDGLILEGDFSACRNIGGKLQGGQLIVRGHAGDQLAADMRAGRIVVEGSAGRSAAAELRGGEVIVHGNVGEYAAGAAPGARQGMRGGVLVIHGDCQAWLAARMRRGTVVVHGSVAEGCAARMIAGTLVLCGPVRGPLASGIRRGTILCLDPRTTRSDAWPPAGFTAPVTDELSFLPLLASSFADHLPNWVVYPGERRALRSLGDRADGGFGELIWFDYTTGHAVAPGMSS